MISPWELAEGFNIRFTYFGENAGKYIPFTVPIEKELTRIAKNQMLSMIFLKQFIKLNVNTDTMPKMWHLWNFIQSMQLLY